MGQRAKVVVEREIQRLKRASGRLGEIGDDMDDRGRLLRVVSEVGEQTLQREGND